MQSKSSSNNDFEMLSKLGEGAFGQVFKVKRKLDGNIYALKKVKLGAMKQKERDNALNQIRILASYQGSNIIGYKDAYFDDAAKVLCIVMEFAEGGDILKQIQTHTKKRSKVPEQQIWKALVHMTQGLKQLHDNKILHRDLKCANVFITADGTYKLGDLNVSKVLKMDMAYTQTGTPYYASPEVWKDKPYGVKSDMWSLGCILYEMAALKPPFTAVDLQGLYRKVIAGHFQRIPMHYSNQLQTVIRSLLKINPKQRPNVESVLSNTTVHKNYKGNINATVKKGQENQLLKTIVYDPRNIKGLGAKLPKSQYGHDSSQENSRQKSVKQDRLDLFMKKRRQIEEIQRLRQVKNLENDKEELVKKRERVLSACGVRKNAYDDSPKKVMKTPALENSKKNQLPKLPPRPINQNPSYKLPPRPANIYNNNKQSDSSKLIPPPSAPRSQQRSNSKQNLRNAGQKIVANPAVNAQQYGVRNSSQDKPQRCSSAKKVVYPNWWN